MAKRKYPEIPAGDNPKQHLFEDAIRKGFEYDAPRYVEMIFDNPKEAANLGGFMGEYQRTGNIHLDGSKNYSTKKKSSTGGGGSSSSEGSSGSSVGGGSVGLSIDYDKLTNCIREALASTIIAVDIENSRAIFRSQRLSY